MATSIENISPDLIWEITRNQNSYLVKRKQAGGVQFSRDPFNLTNKHSRKYEGYVNDQAISLSPDSNTVSLRTKTPGKQNKPASSVHSTSFSSSTGSRKVYRSLVSSTAKKGYRSDLRSEAVSRASAIKLSQREKKERAAPKPRGKKAKAAAEKA